MLTVNGAQVVSMRLTLPVSGVWVATFELDSDEVVSGALTLSQSDVATTWAGYAVRSGVVGGSCFVDAIGGAGGLAEDVAARSYREVTAKTVVSEALAAVGEALASTSTRSTLATALPFWTRTAGRASLAISAVADSVGARWRVLPSGQVWFGEETWKAYAGEEPAELDRDPAASTVILATEAIDLAPGVTLRGERIGRVEHSVSRSEPLRTVAWIEAT